MAEAQDGQMLEGLLFALLQIEASRLAPGQVLLVSRTVRSAEGLGQGHSAMSVEPRGKPSRAVVSTDRENPPETDACTVLPCCKPQVEDPHTIQWVVSAMNKTAKVEPPTFAAGGEADGLPSWAAAIADQILAGLAALGQTVAGVAQWLAEMVRSFLGAVGKTVMEVLGVEEKPEHPHGLATAAARTVVLIVMIAVVQHRKHLMP